MSATLVAKNLTAGHGDRLLFSGLDLVVAPGDVIGLVGVNGAGKSTLLRMLAGLAAPEEGTLRLSPATATVGHLPQEPERAAAGASGRGSGRDGAGLPGPAHRRDGRAGRAGRGHPGAGGRGAGRRRRLRGRAWTAG